MTTLSLNSTLDGGGWLTPRPGHFTPGKAPSTHLQEAVRAPGSLRMDAENVAPTGFRSPDPPIRSESLYRLR